MSMDVETRWRVQAFVDDIENALQCGRDMREAQRNYFKNRTSESLFASKALEKAFDHAAVDALRKCKDFLIREGVRHEF